MAKYNVLYDDLKEFKPRCGAIFGVRNGSYIAYVWDLGHEPQSWEGKRFKIQLLIGRESMGWRHESNDLQEAKEFARQTVKGRAFRAFMRRMK